MKETFKVIIAPDYGFDIYIRRLKFYLDKAGVGVKGISYYPFSLVLSCISHKPKILHLHWQSPYIIGRNLIFTVLKSLFFIFEIILIKLLKIKIVWTVHNLVNHEKLFADIERLVSKYLFYFSDSVIVHLYYQKSKLINFYKVSDEKIRVVYEGNFFDISLNFDMIESRNKLGLSKSNILFLFFGYIRKYKGIEFLIKSFKKVSRSDVMLMIVGKPYPINYLNEIKRLADNDRRIFIEGRYLTDNELYTYISASNCIVIPYKDVFNSTVAIMAISFAKPVITSENVHLEEIIEKNFFKVKFNDENSLASVIENVDLKLLDYMGKMAYSKIKDITWDKQAQQTKSIYEELLIR